MKKITMKNPCPKKWENMQGNHNVRLCESCDRNVEDFTNKSVDEIIKILENRKERTCARIFSSQLNPVKKIAAAVLIGGMLVGGSCSPKVNTNHPSHEHKEGKEGYVVMEDESILPVKLNENGKVKIHIQGVVLDGELNEPIAATTIIISNTTIGMITEWDGAFTFEIEIEKESYDTTYLEFDYTGYGKLLVPLKEINMKEGIEVNMFEVDIIGTPVGELLLEEKINFG